MLLLTANQRLSFPSEKTIFFFKKNFFPMISGLDECSVRTTLQGMELRAPQFERSTCIVYVVYSVPCTILARSRRTVWANNRKKC